MMMALDVGAAPLGEAPGCILETKGLTAGYGSFSVIHDIDIEVREAEVVALLGPNGQVIDHPAPSAAIWFPPAAPCGSTGRCPRHPFIVAVGPTLASSPKSDRFFHR